MAPGPTGFGVGDAPVIRGETSGTGPAVVLCHGITATRRYVIHGSRALERAGHSVVTYDARGHGESDPAPEGEGYGYPELVADLEQVVRSTLGEEGGSSSAGTRWALTRRWPTRSGTRSGSPGWW
jgi:pimeloyl-ACP methyl ester carboxylesterase